MRSPFVIWVLGPIGAGKSLILSSLAHHRPRILNQDQLFEALLREHGLPFDFRLHNDELRKRASGLRKLAGESAWQMLPQWLLDRQDFYIESVGDKPEELRQAVNANTAAGFSNLALVLNCDIDVCLQRNRSRNRVLRDEVVIKHWRSFQACREQRVHERVFSEAGMTLIEDAANFCVEEWLNGKQLALQLTTT